MIIKTDETRKNGGGGQVVGVLALYSDDASSNPAETYSFLCKNCVWKERLAHLKSGGGSSEANILLLYVNIAWI